MTQLAPLRLNDGTVIYVETTDNASPPLTDPTAGTGEETTRTGKGIGDQGARNFQIMQSTIRAYTSYTLDAFKQLAGANVNKVTLEFGIKIAGEAGIPYVTKGTAESNLKVTVECSFLE
jgi:hypothetical protein